MPDAPSSPAAPPGAVVLFDGVCNLCNASVQFILKRDRAGYFRFASLQSAAGERIQREHGLPPEALDSVVLVEGGRAYTKSDAALRIARRLGGAWPAAGAFRIVPAVVRDAAYDVVARNRYRWFGKQDACMLPTPELRARFLE